MINQPGVFLPALRTHRPCRRRRTLQTVIPSRTSGISVSLYARYKVCTDLVFFNKFSTADDAWILLALIPLECSLAWKLSSGQLRRNHDTVNSGKTFFIVAVSFL